MPVVKRLLGERENMMKVEGACHCGAIRYEAEVDPATATICHCTDCQTLSGSAFRTVVQAPKSSFRLLSGRPKAYIKTAESGNKRVQAFCADCGTPIYSSATTEDFPAYSLRVGPLKQRGQLKPKIEVFRRSALDWNPALEGTKCFETRPPG
jgi:hypothetical protein